MNKGIIKMGMLSLSVLIIAALVIFVLPVFAASFTAVIVPNETNSTIPNQLLTFVVANTEADQNITSVSISFPGFVYLNWSNSTTATDIVFTNSTTVVTWSNTTEQGFILNGTTQNFTINLSVPSIKGAVNFNVSTNDTAGTYTSANVTIIVNDVSVPTFTGNQSTPASDSPGTYSPATYSMFNVTWNDNIEVDKVVITIRNTTDIIVNNASMSNATFGSGIYNYSVILPAGTWNWTTFANDTSGNMNASDIWTITLNKAVNSLNLYLNDTQNANETYIYPYIINATGTSLAGIVNISMDGSLVAVGFLINQSELLLGVGSHAYNVTASGNENYSQNATGITYYADIGNGTVTLNLTLNDNDANVTYTYPNAISASVTKTPTVNNEGNLSLWRDGVIVNSTTNGDNVSEVIVLGNGTYNYSSTFTATNYSSASATNIFAIVNKGAPNVKTYIDDSSANKTVEYPTSVTVVGNSTTVVNPPSFGLYAADVLIGPGNPASLSSSVPLGLYNIIYNTSDHANWTTVSNNTLYLNVTQNTTNPVLLTINNGTSLNNQNVSITYGTSISVNCSNTYSGSGSCSLYRNENTSIGNNETITLGAGNYSYKVNTTGNTNYTGNATGVTYYVTVAKATNPVVLFLNGTNNSNVSYTYPNAINATGTAVGGTVYVYRDGVNKTNGTSPQSENILLGVASYAYKVNATGNDNYTDNATGVTYYATVGKGTTADNMHITINTFETDKSVTSGTAVNLTAYEDNTGDSDCNYTMYGNSVYIANTSSSTASYPTLSLAASTYTYVYNTSGCANWSSGTTSNRILVVTAASSNVATTGGLTTTTSTTPYVRLSKGKANITLSSLTTEGKMMATIAKYEDVAIRAMNITVVNNVANIKLVITKINALPSTVPYDIDGMVYNYITVDETNITNSDVKAVGIKFAVNKSWLANNGIDSSNITLYRWGGSSWTDLKAVKSSEDLSEVFYSATSPGLSVFVIGVVGNLCTPNWSCTDWSACANGQQARTCADVSSCGTTNGKPAESQACAASAEPEATPEATNQTAGVTQPTSSFPLMPIAIVIVIVIVSIFAFMNRAKIMPHLSKAKTTAHAHMRRASVEKHAYSKGDYDKLLVEPQD